MPKSANTTVVLTLSREEAWALVTGLELHDDMQEAQYRELVAQKKRDAADHFAREHMVDTARIKKILSEAAARLGR